MSDMHIKQQRSSSDPRESTAHISTSIHHHGNKKGTQQTQEKKFLLCIDHCLLKKYGVHNVFCFASMKNVNLIARNYIFILKVNNMLSGMVHTFNPSPREAQAGGCL